MTGLFRRFLSRGIALAACGFVGLAGALEQRAILSLELAKKMADACESKARSEAWRTVNIAIFDAGGNLKLFRRQDDAFLGSVDIAQLKARSSVMIPLPTRDIGDKIAYKEPNRPHGIEHVPGIVVFPGGLPIKTKDGQLLGGIGVSGATSDQDEQCAQAGIDAIAEYLADD